MATVVNNPQDSSSGPMMGVALLILGLVVLFLFWGFSNPGATPAPQPDVTENTEVNTEFTPPDPGNNVNVDIPEEVDVNVSQPEGGAE